MSTKTNPRPNIVSRLVWLFFILVPTALCIFLAIQVRTISNQQSTVNAEERIICFSTEQCAIEVDGIWYQISGVIDMTETIPEEYLPAPEEVPADQVDDDAVTE